jgi:hypothetical protein
MDDHTPFNRAIWITTLALGVTIALGGFHHGVFEALQGNGPTGGIAINSIGPEHVRWEYGTDPAITLIPNFLFTGVAAMAVSLVIVGWSALGLHRRRGPALFLALFVLLTLVGGGVGHILFFVAAWAYATRMRSSLGWWRRRLRGRARSLLGRLWAPVLTLSSICFVLALELSVFGYPPARAKPDLVLAVDWSLLLACFALLNLAYLGAIARDLEPA